MTGFFKILKGEIPLDSNTLKIDEDVMSRIAAVNEGNGFIVEL